MINVYVSKAIKQNIFELSSVFILKINQTFSTVSTHSEACQALSSVLSTKTLNLTDITVLFQNYSSSDPPPIDLIQNPQFVNLLVNSLFRSCVSINPEHASKYAYLLAYATQKGDERNINKDELKSTIQAIEKTHRICNANPAPRRYFRVPCSPVLRLDTLELEYCEKIFDYLDLIDLVTLSQTCKRLYRVASCVLNQTYTDLDAVLDNDGLSVKYERNDRFYLNYPYRVEEKFCLKHLQMITIFRDSDVTQLRNMHSILPAQLEIKLEDKFSVVQLQRLQNVFAKVETLYFQEYKIDGNFHELLALCPNLKRLMLNQYSGSDDYTNIIGDNNEWLRHKYPTIECFELDYCSSVDENLLKTFLENNPNIRQFRFQVHSDNWSEDLFMNVQVQLDELTIDTTFDNELIKWLHKLYERGFYKRLHLQSSWTNMDRNVELASVRGLVKLSLFDQDWEDIDMVHPSLSGLSELQVLRIHKSGQIVDFRILPNTLKSLQRLQMKSASFDEISPFICRSVKLSEIVIHEQLRDGIYFSSNTNIINLIALNREREKIAFARKITIYVAEKIYLATKWALKDTDYKLVRLERIQSFDKDGFEFW